MQQKVLGVFIFVISIFTIQIATAQSSSIRGRVIDAQAQFPIPGVIVQLVDTDEYASTDQDGYYLLKNIPRGRQTIQVSYIGFETQVLPNILVEIGKQTLLNIGLVEQIIQLDEAVVTAIGDKSNIQKGLTPVSAKTFDVEETRRYAGSRNDVARMAAGFAGVNVSNDSRNDIVIRGNSPMGLLWRMEEVDIPNPNHFGALGVTGGPVSMLNNNVLDKSSFLTGAFPAMYGNATAGVFDLSLRNGNTEKREYLFQAGFAGLEAGAEGYFKKGSRASYLINYRYTMTGIISKLFGVNFGTGSAVPIYQDVTFKINLPTTKAGTFELFGLGGISSIDFRPESDANFFNASDESLDYKTNSYVLGLKHTYFFNNKTMGKFTLSQTRASVNTINDKLQSFDDGTLLRTPIYRDQSSETRLSARYMLNHKVNAQHNFSTGIIVSQLLMNYEDSTYIENTQSFRRLREYDGNAFFTQVFGNWQFKPSQKLTLNTGAYFQHFALNQTKNFEPRFGLNYKLTPNQNFSIGLGRHSQLQALQTYFNTIQNPDGSFTQTNLNLDASISDQAVLGFTTKVGKKSKLKLEAYYQALSRIPVNNTPSSFSILNMGSDFTVTQQNNLVNEGIGRNYGIELSMERTFDKYYYLITGSFFQSKYQGSDGIWRNTFFNANRVINVIGGREFKLGKNTQLALDTKITTAGGKRFTPILLNESIAQGQTVRDNSRAFEGQFRDYFRMDFKITFRVNHKKVMEEWFIDFQNATNTRNIFWQDFNANTGRLSTSYQLGFFPNFNYRLQF